MNVPPSSSTERLTSEQCWKLLGKTAVGRLAVILEGRPEIFPVNYVVDEGSIVFRTAMGSKFWASLAGTCALEVDGYSAISGKAWSVVVHARARFILDRLEKARVDSLRLEPWEPGEKAYYMRLTPDTISGRRFRTVPPGVWTTSLNDDRLEPFKQ